MSFLAMKCRDQTGAAGEFEMASSQTQTPRLHVDPDATLRSIMEGTATAKGDHKIPILVLEGSGRFAQELATAFRTGHANQRILKAIIQGGDIKLLATGEGVETMVEKLESHFSQVLED